MRAVLSWTMASYDDANQYLLIDHVLFMVETYGDPALQTEAIAIVYESAEQAREVAVRQTEADEMEGYTLDGPVRLSRTSAHPDTLAYAYRDRTPVWPVMSDIIAGAERGEELS